MTPKEYLEQVFVLEKELGTNPKKKVTDFPHPFCSINAKKIGRMLELTQEINELTDERSDLKLKYGHREGYRHELSQ